jgi:hypothetical protein
VSDTEWFEIDRAVASATSNFQRGVDFARHASFREDDLIGAALRMGFMHAIQAGHTSLENALLRMMDLVDEPRPRGDSWHADLIARASVPLGRRPAIFPADLAAAADETRRFRNRATRAYDNFDPARIQPTVEAAAVLAQALASAVADYRKSVDP